SHSSSHHPPETPSPPHAQTSFCIHHPTTHAAPPCPDCSHNPKTLSSSTSSQSANTASRLQSLPTSSPSCARLQSHPRSNQNCCSDTSSPSAQPAAHTAADLKSPAGCTQDPPAHRHRPSATRCDAQTDPAPSPRPSRSYRSAQTQDQASQSGHPSSPHPSPPATLQSSTQSASTPTQSRTPYPRPLSPGRPAAEPHTLAQTQSCRHRPPRPPAPAP